MASTPNSVDDYISGFPPDVREKLERLRHAIRKAAPKAEEVISYKMPLYKLNGMLVSFAAWKNHIGMYPTPATTGELKKKIEPFEGSKATLKFPLDKPLPLTLISKLVKLRVAENEKRRAAKSKAKMKG